MVPTMGGQDSFWTAGSNAVARIMGFSLLTSFFQAGSGGASGGTGSYMLDSAKLFILGTIIETGRRFCEWLWGRFNFQYSITAMFSEGDPAYEWIILFLTQEKVWQQSREFRVTASSSLRTWGVSMQPTDSASLWECGDDCGVSHADYVPTYDMPRLFRWGGYWMEMKKNRGPGMPQGGMMMGAGQPASSISLTIYSRDMRALSRVVEEARTRYISVSQPVVTVYQANNGPSMGTVWSSAKRKRRRPLSSVILQEGLINSLVRDARQFLKAEAWYNKAGIPHRRGYLLHGPPGTGKTSTIYSIAGELNLEIFSLSLAASFVDDGYLQRAVSAIPKKAIFLLEDIDCAFPSRDGDDDDEPTGFNMPAYPGAMMMPGRARGSLAMGRSRVTLSGLLNVLDGVGSEEGKLFFATTNYIDHLDSALIRPGRIDRKIQYRLASKAQAAALFVRFFPEGDLQPDEENDEEDDPMSQFGDCPLEEKSGHVHTQLTLADVQDLSQQFSRQIPEDEFSTAELQGFLLGHRKDPLGAVKFVDEWVAQERRERKERKEREAAKKAKAKSAKETREAVKLGGSLAKLSALGVKENSLKDAGGGVDSEKHDSEKQEKEVVTPPNSDGPDTPQLTETKSGPLIL